MLLLWYTYVDNAWYYSNLSLEISLMIINDAIINQQFGAMITKYPMLIYTCCYGNYSVSVHVCLAKISEIQDVDLIKWLYVHFVHCDESDT